jgi:uncharacterized RDD family membrane protein YckC
MSRPADGSDDTLRTAGLLRRLPAVVLDALPALAAVALAFVFGGFDARIFSAPEGWFWSEWFFRYWLDDRAALLAPLATFFVLAITWTAIWEATAGQTPAARLLNLRVLDRAGAPIGAKHAGLRAVGAALNVATLGLGYLWILVSRYRRGVHDLLAATVVVYR